jgi:hypothetical protein
MRNEIQSQKNTLLKNAQSNAESNFLRECFFATPRKIKKQKITHPSKKTSF